MVLSSVSFVSLLIVYEVVSRPVPLSSRNVILCTVHLNNVVLNFYRILLNFKNIFKFKNFTEF